MADIAHYIMPGLALVDHEFELPVDHDVADAAKLTVYARQVTSVQSLSKILSAWMSRCFHNTSVSRSAPPVWTINRMNVLGTGSALDSI